MSRCKIMSNTLILNRLTRPLFLILSAFLIACLLIFYIFQVASMAKERFLINFYESKISQVEEINKNLEVNFFQFNSLKNIDSLADKLSFEKIEKVHYIRVLEDAVAAK